MRKSIGTLASLVEREMGLSPFSEDYYIFSNRQKNIIKILYWHVNGFALWTKRLEKDRFPWPNHSSEVQELSEERILYLLRGIDDRKEHKPLYYSCS